MFNQNGLSLDQAPPISVVFRFFLGGGLFGVVASFLILTFGTSIFDYTAKEALILTHTLTLGVMLSFMFAALFQMLPVIAGVTLTAPTTKAAWVQYPLSTGIITLLLAFYIQSNQTLFMVASVLLGGTITTIAIMMLSKLLRLPNHSASSKGMSIALLGLIALTLLALYLTGTLAGIVEGAYYTSVKQAHFSFGLFGWVALLIISISFQVIEMFYVTPSYPTITSRYLPIILFVLLIAMALLPTLSMATTLLIAFILMVYALLTLRRLTQRKRPLADATVWLWRIGMGMLLLSMGAATIHQFTHHTTLLAVCAILFAGFALSIVFAMFYKIVPFLTWFHLSAQGYFTAPMMHEVIHPKTAMKHLYIHTASFILLLGAVALKPLIYIAGVTMLLSFGWMLWQVIHAWKLYIHTQRTGEKFDLNTTPSHKE